MHEKCGKSGPFRGCIFCPQIYLYIWDHWTIITFHSPNSKFPLSFLFHPLPVLHFGSHTLPLAVSLMFLASLFVKDNKSDSKHYMCIETYLIEPIFLQPVSSTDPRHLPHKDPGTRPFWNQPKSKACLGLEFHWSSGWLASAGYSAFWCKRQSYCLCTAWKLELNLDFESKKPAH